ncbi:MAG: hypothetical protein H6Q79_2194 [Deltaproteobacteria bacterium]|nr:hypothetical protein [Deltaproteobacteria bacterium]
MVGESSEVVDVSMIRKSAELMKSPLNLGERTNLSFRRDSYRQKKVSVVGWIDAAMLPETQEPGRS